MMATEAVQSTAPTEPQVAKVLPALVMHEPTKLPTHPDDPGYWIRIAYLHQEETKYNTLYVH